MSAEFGYGNGFALIVVLFILLIIVGTSYVGGYGAY
ncbi:YjcZ family sporulation protein [Virgibacillus sp. FSP13]